MKKVKNTFFANKILSFALVLVIVFVVGAVVNAAVDGRIFQNIENYYEAQEEKQMGGTTADDINIGGNLAVTGTTALTGAVTMSGSFGSGFMTRSGTALASSTVNSAETLSAANLISYNHITYTPNVAAMSLTLPASSTLATLIPNTGDMITKTINNATSTAGITVTLVAGAGENIATSSVNNLVINPGKAGLLTFLRKANSDIQIFLQNGY